MALDEPNLRLDSRVESVLEPVFVKYNVSVVLSGHEHFYERVKPQKGIQYFISGAGGKLRKGNISRDELLDKGFDQDCHFMLMEILLYPQNVQLIQNPGVKCYKQVASKTKSPLLVYY
jgi:hypothetical protein